MGKSWLLECLLWIISKIVASLIYDSQYCGKTKDRFGLSKIKVPLIFMTFIPFKVFPVHLRQVVYCNL